MATSGSIDYAVSRDDIITEALEQCGVLAEGQSPTAAQLTSCARTLNMMVKEFQADAENLFAVERLNVFLKKDQSKYTLSSSSSDYFAEDTVETQLSADASSGATSISVDSITGISASDVIGVEVANNVVHWTTVNGAPSGPTVTLATGLSAAAVTDGYVYTFTSRANRPMKILQAYVRDKANNDIPLTRVAREDYINLTKKDADGKINTIYYDPQVSGGLLYVWPETSNETDRIVIWVQRTLEDFDAAGDNPDFPQEWYWALSINLANRLKFKYALPARTQDRIKIEAMEALEVAASFDVEDYMKIEPDFS